MLVNSPFPDFPSLKRRLSLLISAELGLAETPPARLVPSFGRYYSSPFCRFFLPSTRLRLSPTLYFSDASSSLFSFTLITFSLPQHQRKVSSFFSRPIIDREQRTSPSFLLRRPYLRCPRHLFFPPPSSVSSFPPFLGPRRSTPPPLPCNNVSFVVGERC